MRVQKPPSGKRSHCLIGDCEAVAPKDGFRNNTAVAANGGALSGRNPRRQKMAIRTEMGRFSLHRLSRPHPYLSAIEKRVTLAALFPGRCRVSRAVAGPKFCR